MPATSRTLAVFTLCLLLSVGALTSCATDSKQNPLSTPGKPQSDKSASQSTPTESIHATNRSLSYGYAQLYEAASGLKHIDKLLYVKYESDKVEAVIDDISQYGERPDSLRN